MLQGSMVASSFGKLVMKENPRENVHEEDIALALLMMITNNIGQVAYLNAQLHHCSKIFFVGSFLRHNPISCRRLAFAIDFWSSGSMEALFLMHEGYFGALGTFLYSVFGEDTDRILKETQGQQEEAKSDLVAAKTQNQQQQSLSLSSSSTHSVLLRHSNSASTSPKQSYLSSQEPFSPNQQVQTTSTARGRSTSEDFLLSKGSNSLRKSFVY
jgi:hypothetical protein